MSRRPGDIGDMSGAFRFFGRWLGALLLIAALLVLGRDLPAPLWDPVMIVLLRLWAAPAFALSGLLLYLPNRKRRRR